ncbi:MAG: TonB system transporter [Gammaproteobacteria bacterium]|nr:MAG: TonB system transporter [Gammaproteobacteria bacterium]
MKHDDSHPRIAALLTLLAVSALPAAAQEDGAQDWIARSEAAGHRLEYLEVTGSYLRGLRQEDLPTPLLSFDREELGRSGAVRLADVTQHLTINSGAENNPDAFTQNFSTGTENINLRGLGVASTLVLLNGRRQTYSAVTTNQGQNFVDTASLVPMIAVDRVEILKDGAASLYGSDAVGGVVNFYTRDDFEGAELTVDYLSGDHGQEETRLSALFGWGDAGHHLLLAASLFDRAGLGTDRKRLSRPEDDTSNAGMPGSFLVPARPTGPTPDTVIAWTAAFDADNSGVADFFEGTSSTPPAMADPNCEEVAARYPTSVPPSFPLPLSDGAAVPGLCRFEFGSFYSLVPEEERKQLFSRYRLALGENLTLDAELGWADNHAERRNSPSFPIATPLPVPASHPNNPFGVDVLFVGRVLGSGAEALISRHDSETLRAVAGLEGLIGDSGWRWRAEYGHSRNDYLLTAQDALRDALSAALLDGSYNPFAAAPPAAPNANPPEAIDAVLGDFRMDTRAQLDVLEARADGDLFELPGGAARLAVGLQHRRESLRYDYDDNANNDNYLFFVGNPDFDADRDIDAVYGEIVLPLHARLDVQFSVRSEDYGDSVDSTDPKLALRLQAADSLVLRASVGTSFRAPSLFQQHGVQTTLEEIELPTGGSQFLPISARANPADPLAPEQADVTNLGATLEALDERLQLHLDYWRYEYQDVIIKQSAQAVFEAAFVAGDPAALAQIDFQDGVPPGVQTIERINIYYDNASRLDTDGVDLGLRMLWDDVAGGRLRGGLELTRVLSYDLVDPQAGAVDGLGRRNFTNFATSMPELRYNLNLGYERGRHGLDLYWRHIDDYLDDQNDREIDAHRTLDLQYRVALEGFGGGEAVQFALGAINLTDEDPPYVATNGGYDAKVHDPRGRLFYLRLTVPVN